MELVDLPRGTPSKLASLLVLTGDEGHNPNSITIFSSSMDRVLMTNSLILGGDLVLSIQSGRKNRTNVYLYYILYYILKKV